MKDDPQNLFNTIELFQEEITIISNSNHQQIKNELNTALFHYYLPQVGFQRTHSGRKMTFDEKESGQNFTKSLPIKNLLKMRELVQRSFEENNVSQANRNTYGGRIEKFLTWASQQIWWPGSRREKIKDQCCPPLRNKNGRVANNKLTERNFTYKKYILTAKQTPPLLQAQLDEFFAYLTEIDYPGRVVSPICISTAKEYLKNIQLNLGYLHNIENVSLETLSLDLIVPLLREEDLEHLSNSEQKKLWKQKKQSLDIFICKYLKFIRDFNNSQSPHTRMTKLTSITALAKFLYINEVERDTEYREIPLFSVLDNRVNEITEELTEWRNNKRSVSEWSKKWPDVPPGKTALEVIQEQIVEPLRLECRPRNKRGDFRPAFSLAESYKNYLKWGLLSYLPARRQEEYRELRIALSCPISRPKHIPLDGLYQPLPPNEQRSHGKMGGINDNFLYFTYSLDDKFYPQGVWVLDTKKYKTAKTHGGQSIIITNPVFEDGSCFYDYIERYLYGWWSSEPYKNRQAYTWWNPELQGRFGKWLMSGRFEFQPVDSCILPHDEKSPIWTWGYVFIQSKTGLCANGTSFAKVFESSSQRLISKRISPHTLRSAWATWAYQKNSSDAEIRSLAYAMGHSEKTLRGMYEKCTPAEKRQAIEEAIAQKLFKNGGENKKELQLLDLEDLVRMAMLLKVEEQEILIARLQN